jgi:peptidoglycan/xylan/chitin deacetylase (PgdA/CDA1 family)
MIRRSIALLVSLALGTIDSILWQVRRLLNRSLAGNGVVLYYHAVKPRERAGFAWQMDELLKRAHLFTAGSPETMAREGRNVAVTFDDGFHSVLENAVPELIKRSIPFTMFVPSGCLGTRPCWVQDPQHPSWDERVLSAAELRSLASHPLATLGSHSITHPNFVDIDSDRARKELVQSKADLETAAETEVDLFSFPHGAHSPALVEEARRAGYRRVFTIEPTTIESNPGVFIVGRVGADPHDWRIEFRLKIAGAYRWRSSLHRLRQTVSATT